jgi:hypothetical protein
VVDTTVLRALRLGPQINVLLRSLVLNASLVPAESVFLNFTSELPAGLRLVLESAQLQGMAWCAWRTGDEVSAVSAELDEPLATQHGRPVLRVLHHDGLGGTDGPAGWIESEPDVWSRCDLR